jgi:hypothetical protein
VRVVRQIAPNGQTRLLMTNLIAAQAPAHCFGALYHQRRRIEEAFKRLKHRLRLESASGLSQHALLIDGAAKILADNLASLLVRRKQERVSLARQAVQSDQRPDCVPAHRPAVAGVRRRDRHPRGHGAGRHCADHQRRKLHRSAPRCRPTVKPHRNAGYKG